MTRATLRFGAVLLAAGASSRMGQPKLLLPWAGTTVIAHLLQAWRSVGAEQIAVVCAPPPHALHEELDRLSFPASGRIINPSPELGMFGSIQCAASWSGWLNELTHCALALGDQPQISAESICAVLRHVAQHPEKICQPTFEGRPKHPIVFPRALFHQLARAQEGTLRHFLERHPQDRSFIEVPDRGLNFDLDSPEDYRFALAQFVDHS